MGEVDPPSDACSVFELHASGVHEIHAGLTIERPARANLEGVFDVIVHIGIV
jgi:hypothetical protein